jgi:hypothetical protein
LFSEYSRDFLDFAFTPGGMTTGDRIVNEGGGFQEQEAAAGKCRSRIVHSEL